MFLSNAMEKEADFAVLSKLVTEDENVKKIYTMPGILPEYSQNAYEAQAQQTDEIGLLLQTVQDLTTELTKLQSESAERYEALRDKHDKALLEIVKLQERIDAYDRSVLDRVSERLAAMGNGFSSLKAGICDHANDFVLDFRVNGKEAAARSTELFDIEGKLQWMRGCIANGIYELNKSMEKQVRLASAYQQVYDAADTAMNAAGKDKSILRAMAGMKRDFAIRSEQLFRKLVKAYEALGSHLDNMMEHLSDYVRNAHRQKDMRMADKLEAAKRISQRTDIAETFKDMPELD